MIMCIWSLLIVALAAESYASILPSKGNEQLVETPVSQDYTALTSTIIAEENQATYQFTRKEKNNEANLIENGQNQFSFQFNENSCQFFYKLNESVLNCNDLPCSRNNTVWKCNTRKSDITCDIKVSEKKAVCQSLGKSRCIVHCPKVCPPDHHIGHDGQCRPHF